MRRHLAYYSTSLSPHKLCYLRVASTTQHSCWVSKRVRSITLGAATKCLPARIVGLSNVANIDNEGIITRDTNTMLTKELLRQMESQMPYEMSIISYAIHQVTCHRNFGKLNFLSVSQLHRFMHLA